MKEDRKTESKSATNADLTYNECCVYTLLNVSVSMECFFTMITAFYLNWRSCGDQLSEEQKRVIMLGTPLLYKKYFINN